MTQRVLLQIELREKYKELMSFLGTIRVFYFWSVCNLLSNKELDLVYRTTGKYLVIRFSSKAWTPYICHWWQLQWHAAAADWCQTRRYRRSYVANPKAPFLKILCPCCRLALIPKLSKAVTNTDISSLLSGTNPCLIRRRQNSKECYGIILDIDNMAGKPFTQKVSVSWYYGVRFRGRRKLVLVGSWRRFQLQVALEPMYPYDKLFQTRQPYMGLERSECRMPRGQNTFDIASVDIYMNKDKDFGSRYGTVRRYSENGRQATISLSLSLNAAAFPMLTTLSVIMLWSFFGLWYGSYVSKR